MVVASKWSVAMRNCRCRPHLISTTSFRRSSRVVPFAHESPGMQHASLEHYPKATDTLKVSGKSRHASEMSALEREASDLSETRRHSFLQIKLHDDHKDK